MNSFEIDLKRALLSKGFAAGIILEIFILFRSGFDSELFRISVPIIAALPFSTAWLNEYRSGFVKLNLTRTTVSAYINGKFLACSLSGGLAEFLGCFVFHAINIESSEISLLLVFFSGMFWAAVSAVLAAWSDNRYIAYGGGFVIYYILVMLIERNFDHLYCLYPYEWFSPAHVWIFGQYGVVIMLIGFLLLFMFFYHYLLRRRIKNV